MWQFGAVTLLPEMFAALDWGVTGRSFSRGLAQLTCFNPRTYAVKKDGRVDDHPYGGGPGMVLMYEPLKKTIDAARVVLPGCRVIYPNPKGIRIEQKTLQALAVEKPPLLFVAGRYEGIDERLISQCVDEEWSLGDFVLSGGELAIMAFMDALLRLLPESLGDETSAWHDSFTDGLLEYPQYTRPAEIDGHAVPPILLSGHQANILRWRRKQALGLTWLKRPDLLLLQSLSELDEQLLAEFKQEHSA